MDHVQIKTSSKNLSVKKQSPILFWRISILKNQSNRNREKTLRVFIVY